jgi:RimJ/RimL family protein N-acetyltransferase
MVPVIDTERLVLREHRVADLDDCAAMWGDLAVTRYIGGRPFSREDVWARLLRYRGHWALLDYGFWVICERASGRFVGEVGLADFKREIEPAITVPEAGWVLAPWAHGRGYATEAMRAVLAWGDSRLPGDRTVCIISPDNAPSIGVATKCGFREQLRASYHGEAAILYERARGAS